MNKPKLGFALCGSFCTFDKVIAEMEKIKDKYDIYPIMSPCAAYTDTRFGKCEDFKNKIIAITGKKPITTIPEAEPIGPKKLLDVLLIAPCTGNTLGKLSCGIYDTSVTLATKSHLRNERPTVIAVSTNDALSTSSKNIGTLLNCKNIFFVPMNQDNPYSKYRSVVADFTKIDDTIQAALEGKQIQPIIYLKNE